MKNTKKIIAVILALTMLVGLVQLASFAQPDGEKVTASLPFATISDIHIYPQSETGNRCDAWLNTCNIDTKMFDESEAILRTGLDTLCERAKKTGIKYVLIPGDLTKDSEYAGHVALAKIFEEYEKKYGMEFLVINGNHDVNTLAATTYNNGKKEQARPIKAEEFPEVYKNLGYDLAIDRYAQNGEKIQGALSYIADLGDDYRLIVVDSNLYSFDEPLKEQTGGVVTPELMQWVKKWADKSKEDGKIPMMMIHHSLAPHMEVEPSITYAFIIDNYREIAEQFASWGIHYAFTGHLHLEDTACVINDDGDVIYDFQTDSLTGYPNEYREFVIETLEGGKSRITSKVVDFDDVKKFTFDGVTYDNNKYKYKSFDICFGGRLSENGKASVTQFLMSMVKVYGGSFITQIGEAGGIIPFLKTMNLDVETILKDLLKPYIKDGIRLGGTSILSVDNLMWFINDLDSQLCELYIKDPDKLYGILEDAVNKLLALQVSDYPCTKYLDEFGFGDKSKPGTLADAIISAMTYWYNSDEDRSDDIFMNDVIDKLENGDTLERLFNTLVDILLHDIIEDSLLAKLEIRLDKLFAEGILRTTAGNGINYLLKNILRNDLSYMNLVKVILGYGILPWTSIYDILDQLLISKYVTPSFFRGLGQFVAYVLNDFTSDENPKLMGDDNVVYTSDKCEVEVNTKNYRLPTMVSVTMGEDSKSEATISWFSKSSLPESDIEIYKAASAPTFTGKATQTADFTINKEGEKVQRMFPGIDLGVMGLFKYYFPLYRHTVKLSNLEKGSTYFYRVGNEKYNWWSETGSVTTADGGKKTTFFHFCDPQSMNDRQYNESWVKTLDAAYKVLPDADFIVNTGDLVDHGDNSKQWQGMFDTASKYLMNTYLMPATGNHEGKGTNATANYFVLPNMPEQDTTSGVYYSYTYNNAHFAVLNTEALGSDNGISDEQIEWLKKDMTASDSDWKFVVLHKAPYSQGSHYKDKDVCAIRDQLSVLMPELGIDMVFQGHDHVYMRTASLINNEKESTTVKYLEHNGDVYKTLEQPKGTTYVISGCSGVKLYKDNDSSKTDKYFPRGEKLFALESQMFSAVEIEDGVLYFSAYTVDEKGTTQVDKLAIQKDKTQGKVVENYTEAEQQEEESKLQVFFKTLFEYVMKVFKVIINLYKIYVLRVEL